MSERSRLAWFAAVALVAIFGVGELARWILESLAGPSWWAIDFRLVVDAGERLRNGLGLYDDPKFLYPPLAAVVAFPLTFIDPFPVSIAYALLKVVLAGACAAVLTAGWQGRDRLLAFVGLVTCLPFLHDLFLGNANALIVAAMVPAVFGSPRFRNGLLLGLATAVFAKPLVIPVILWLLVRRRGTFGGVIAAGLGATGLGVLAAGPAAYGQWLEALAAGSRFAAAFAGNHGVTALAPDLWAPVAAVTAAGLLLVLWRRGPRVGLAWACASGILLAPYAGTYAALPVALALPALGPLAPALALAVVVASPVATTHPLPFFAAAIMLGALLLREPRVNARWEPIAAPRMRAW